MDLTIIPLEFNNNELLTDLIEKLRQISILAKVKHLDNINIQDAYDIQRRQFYSTKILEIIIDNYKTNIYTLILTDKDLYVPVLTHIFGESQLNGNYSIVSTFRLNEELYISKPNYQLLLERTYKEIIHELGHNKGLKHCHNYNCVMHSATTVEDIDARPAAYCEACQKILTN